jgi:FMN phosphatase YigB (HAD superfamily)
MRQVLKPSNIFSLAARRFVRKHKNQNDMDIQLISQIEDTFPEIRAAAEKQKGIEKTIHDYYGKIEQKYQIPSAVMEELKDIEFQVELEYMIPRKKMTELFHYALSSGKTVYVISDMYYTEAQLRMLLAHCGIKGDFPILVSCEHHASKEAGTLFPLFTGLFENSAVPVRHRFLHIGDNRLADKAMAEAAGIDSFIVMSAYELLTASSIQQLLSETGDSEYNKILGFYISTAFNDPFALSRTKGCVVIESLFDIGRYCIAPLLFEYMFWLKNRLIESKIEQMIFSSRDGYVPCMLYRIMRKEFPELPEPVYLKTSRRAVTVAAIKNTSDILRLAERPFRGTIGDFFVQRYGIEIEENDAPLEWQFCDDLVVLLEKYSSVILQNAVLERRSYMDYLKQMNIISSCKKGFFDFVAGGTVQYYLEKLLGERLQGYYFATMNLPNPMYRMDDIDAAYGNITSYGSNHPFARYYLMLESILTDPDSTFVKIDEYGNFVFTENINTIYDQIKPVHDGVLYYFNERFALEYRDMINKNPSLRGAEKLFGVLFDETCKIPDKLKAVFKNDDIYDGQRLYQSFSA